MVLEDVAAIATDGNYTAQASGESDTRSQHREKAKMATDDFDNPFHFQGLSGMT
jgi:hypothetical protein